MPGPTSSTSITLLHTILQTPRWSWYYCCSYFTDEETEAERWIHSFKFTQPQLGVNCRSVWLWSPGFLESTPWNQEIWVQGQNPWMLGCVASRESSISMSLRLLIYKRDVTALVLQGCCEDALALCKFWRALSLISRWPFSIETFTEALALGVKTSGSRSLQ